MYIFCVLKCIDDHGNNLERILLIICHGDKILSPHFEHVLAINCTFNARILLNFGDVTEGRADDESNSFNFSCHKISDLINTRVGLR